ncbi:MAG: zf-HC2 domain-containing protein [Planctomycetes bacterium]|nr:zf-HC2 domain-containing protein [Planctomycetota bacterium]
MCPEFGPLRDAFAAGAISERDAERLRRHLEKCPACRADLRERAALRRVTAELTLPPAPPQLRKRILAALDTVDRRWTIRRLARWSTLAAAGLVAVALVTPAGADVPRLMAESSEFHDRIVDGSISPQNIDDPRELRRYFQTALGAEVYAPALGCDLNGGCVCSIPEEKLSAPWIIYRRGDTLISLLVVSDRGTELPESARRAHEGRDYFAFRHERNTILCCRTERSCHIWIARLNERELLDIVLNTREGRQVFAGQRLSLRGVTCQACCALVEERAKTVHGVTDAKVDLASMELIITGEQLDLDHVMKALREAGYDAAPRR